MIPEEKLQLTHEESIVNIISLIPHAEGLSCSEWP